MLGASVRASASNLTRRPTYAPPSVRTGVKASASIVELRNKKLATAQARRPEGWQEEAWGYFDDVPELKYAMRFEGNVMAKCRWFAAWKNPDEPDADPIPITDPRANVPDNIAQSAVAEIARLHGPLGGISEIGRELDMNLEIAGEAYLVGIGARPVLDADTKLPTGQFTAEEWAIYSISEVSVDSGTYIVKLAPDDKTPRKLDPEYDTAIRIWQRHPRWSLLPDCNMRGVLNECEALVLLTNLVKAEPKSLMNAGYVTLPFELDTGSADETEPEEGEEAQVSPFVAAIYEGATEAVTDPDSAAAVAPIFLRGPAEYLTEEYVHQVEIKRTMTAVLDARIDKRVERMARGVNLPVEVVMGHQGTTFANAAQVKQDEYDDHFQPKCVLVADAFTTSFMQPNLLDSYPSIDPQLLEQVVVWFDPVNMIRQVDPFDSADTGLEHGAISYEAWRREKGWTEDDAPDVLERLETLAFNLSRLDPGVSTAILKKFAPDLDIPSELPGTSAPAAAASTDTVIADALAASATTKAKANVGYKLMLIDRELRGRLVTAADRAMSRALERAGSRLRSKAGTQRAVVARVRSELVAQRLGPSLVASLIASAGLTEDDLIGSDAFDDLETQFKTWGASAQQQALDLANDVVGISTAQRDALGVRQAGDLDEAWSWMNDQLHDLARAQLYAPDPLAPAIGEFDPTAKVPTGLVRQALARAGGASGLTVQGTNVYVTLANGKPVGGIATGETVMGELTQGGALVEAYEWVYGPAFRAHPYEDHEVLDGAFFTDWDSDTLSGSPFDAYYYPGDHDGCSCDATPVLVPPDTIEE